MRRKHFIGTLLSAACLFPVAAHAVEDEASEAFCQEVVALMASDDFDALDALAERLRKGERDAHGESRLGRFYLCLSRRIGTERQDVEHWNDWTAWAARWIRQSPRSPSAHLVAARIPLNLAWSHRGSGYASGVSAQDWAQFHEYNAVSAAYLQEHKRIAQRDAYWYDLSTQLAARQNQDDEALLAIVDEASSAFPDYLPLHLVAMQHFTPRWGGSTAKMEAFARRSMATLPAGDRAERYARLYWAATEMPLDDALFQQSQVDWPLMRRGLEDLLARYPTLENRNGAQRFACLSGDLATLEAWQRQLVAHIGMDERFTTALVEQGRTVCAGNRLGTS
ncbi:hypothetical protein [Stenotrophomonas maltophilia]|uniref:hypothetical protein n=1 Tax=Stenotrophomonas maltophilia TaxID=40324 RepID=UPI0034DAE8EE